MKFCINCGKKIPKKNKFCPYCGANQKRNNKAKNQHQKSLNGITYTTDDDTKKKSALSAKPGQQTWHSFYSAHRIPVIITSIVCIILVLIFGIKLTVSGIHHYNYPTDKLPPSIANTSQSFQNNDELKMHGTHFTYFSGKGEDTYYYHINSVSYSKPYVYVHCSLTGVRNEANKGATYSEFQLEVHNGSIDSEQPKDNTDGLPD